MLIYKDNLFNKQKFFIFKIFFLFFLTTLLKEINEQQINNDTFLKLKTSQNSLESLTKYFNACNN